MDNHTFKEIKTLVESSYPTPLAGAFKRCRTTPAADAAARHRGLIDLAEVLIKFLAIVQLQEARLVVPDLRSAIFPGEDAFEFLRRPSLGEWAGLLRELCQLRDLSAEPVWMKEIASWYNREKAPRSRAVLERLGEIEGLQLQKGSPTPHGEIVSALVTYRNRYFGHAPHPHDEELRSHLVILEEALACLLDSCSFLTAMHVIHVERVEVGSEGAWRIHGTHLAGVAEEREELVSHHQLQLSELYLAKGDGEILARPVPLGPFMLWRENEKLRRNEAFFYNRSMRTRLEYTSYTSGAALHTRSVGGFKDLVAIELRQGTGEQAEPHLPDEEKAERAERLHKRAMVLMEEKKYEDCLEALELSLEYERRADTLLAMARAQSLLGEPAETVKGTLCACLELEPSNPEAQAMLPGEGEPPREEEAGACDAPEKAGGGALTILHALTPARLREYALPFWLGIFFAWYAFSAICELLTGHIENLLPNLLQFICCALWATQIVLGHSLLRSLEQPLALQLRSMKLERFRCWFREQMRFIFGSFVTAGDRVDIVSTVKGEAAYWWGFPLWTLWLGFSAFTLSVAHTMPFPLALKRFIDYSLIFALGWFVLRFAAGSTLFIVRYSRLSLRPVLTRLNEGGVRSFKSLIAFNCAMTALVYLFYWIMASLSIDPALSFKADIPLLGVTTALYAIWTVLMPVTIRVAVEQAKGSAVYAYAGHIERAFRHFVESPGEETLARYRWLLKHQSVISRIATWPFSFRETLVYVVGSNVILLLVDFWYVSVRLGYWPQVAASLQSLMGR